MHIQASGRTAAGSYSEGKAMPTTHQGKKKKEKKKSGRGSQSKTQNGATYPVLGLQIYMRQRDEIREGIFQNQQNTNKMATKQKCDLKQIMKATSRHKLELHINIYTDFGLEAFISHTLMLCRNEKSSHELYLNETERLSKMRNGGAETVT